MATKAPTSLLSGTLAIRNLDALPNHCVPFFTTVAIGPLTKPVLHRCLARVKNGFLGGASPDPPTACSSPAARLPQEVVDKIIAHLIHDTRGLLTSSLTSRSWYIATIPYLRHTLTTRTSTSYGNQRKETVWPRPLQVASELGWLPFVTRLIIIADYGKGFSQKLFRSWTQREFSTLTNVQELSIHYLDIPSFMPEIQRYFGQFSKTLRSLTLITPNASDRQIVFFIGLFPHLENLTLVLCHKDALEKPGDRTLVPPSIPPLRGWLKARCCVEKNLVTAMIDLFGGLQFRHMDLIDIGGAQLLLYACADTLETLQLDATALRGEKFPSEGIRFSTYGITDRHSLRVTTCCETRLFGSSKLQPCLSLTR
jgi:hypothetical protein